MELAVEELEKLEKISSQCDEMRDWPTGQRILRLGYTQISDKELREQFACDKIQTAENKRRTKKMVKDFCEEEGLSSAEFKKLYKVKVCAIHKKEVKEKAEIAHSGEFVVLGIQAGKTAREAQSSIDHVARNRHMEEVTRLESKIDAAYENKERLIVQGEAHHVAMVSEGISRMREDLDRVKGYGGTVTPRGYGFVKPLRNPFDIAMKESLNVEDIFIGNSWDTVKDCPEVECKIKYVSWDRYMGEEVPERIMEAFKVAKKVGFDKFEVAFPIMEDKPLIDPVLLGLFKDEKGTKRKYEISRWE